MEKKLDKMEQNEGTSWDLALLEKLHGKLNSQDGKVGWALLWLMGVPIPVLLILYLIRGH